MVLFSAFFLHKSFFTLRLDLQISFPIFFCISPIEMQNTRAQPLFRFIESVDIRRENFRYRRIATKKKISLYQIEWEKCPFHMLHSIQFLIKRISISAKHC